MCEHHPDAALIDTFGTTPTDIREAIATLAKKMDPCALGYSVAFILKPLRRHSETRIGAWLQIVFAHSDAVFGDEILALQGGLAGQRPSRVPGHDVEDEFQAADGGCPPDRARLAAMRRKRPRSKKPIETIRS